jgi:hypothetical protein
MRRSWKMTAAAVAVSALALTGCGAAGGSSLKTDNATAKKNLLSARALSVTFRLDDPKGEFKKALMTKGTGSHLTAAQAAAVVGGSVTMTLSSGNGKPLYDTAGTKPTSLSKALSAANMDLTVRTSAGVLGDLRLVGGNLYVRTDWAAIRNVADVSAPGGAAKLDATVASALTHPDIAVYATAIRDVQGGKWLKVPVAQYADRIVSAIQGQTGQAMPSPDPVAMKTFLASLKGAITPRVTLSDLTQTGKSRTVNVDVQAKAAIGAGLAVLQTNRKLFGLPDSVKLPAASDLTDMTSSKVRAVLTIDNGHYTKLRIPTGQIEALDGKPDPTDPTPADLGVSALVLDVTDAAAPVTAPTPDTVSSFDLGQIVDMVLNALAADPHLFSHRH